MKEEEETGKDGKQEGTEEIRKQEKGKILRKNKFLGGEEVGN